MLRGTLSIPTEMAIVLLANTQGLTNPDLQAKLIAASQATAPTAIPLSEEEAEALLDQLPTPTTQDSTELQQARQLLQQFLLSLKQSA